MKIELVEIDGTTAGWTIIAETTEDKLVLGSMRNVEFWGFNDDAIAYNGMSHDPNDENYVAKLHYATPTLKKKQE